MSTGLFPSFFLLKLQFFIMFWYADAFNCWPLYQGLRCHIAGKKSGGHSQTSRPMNGLDSRGWISGSFSLTSDYMV